MPSAEGEIILGVSFLITFFFAPAQSKKKVIVPKAQAISKKSSLLIVMISRELVFILLFLSNYMRYM